MSSGLKLETIMASSWDECVSLLQFKPHCLLGSMSLALQRSLSHSMLKVQPHTCRCFVCETQLSLVHACSGGLRL